MKISFTNKTNSLIQSPLNFITCAVLDFLNSAADDSWEEYMKKRFLEESIEMQFGNTPKNYFIEIPDSQFTYLQLKYPNRSDEVLNWVTPP